MKIEYGMLSLIILIFVCHIHATYSDGNIYGYLEIGI